MACQIVVTARSGGSCSSEHMPDRQARFASDPETATLSRREVLRAGAFAGAALGFARLPRSVRAAIAVPPPSGGLDEVRHVVLYMQENRSFDHYFGALRGVRGFG